MRGVTPVQSIRMRERAYNFSAHFRVENQNSKLRIIRSVKFHACGPMREQIRMTLKMPLV
jgi:hypothetical protein